MVGLHWDPYGGAGDPIALGDMGDVGDDTTDEVATFASACPYAAGEPPSFASLTGGAWLAGTSIDAGAAVALRLL